MKKEWKIESCAQVYEDDLAWRLTHRDGLRVDVYPKRAIALDDNSEVLGWYVNFDLMGSILRVHLLDDEPTISQVRAMHDELIAEIFKSV